MGSPQQLTKLAVTCSALCVCAAPRICAQYASCRYSVQGFGKQRPGSDHYVYPASGKTADSRPPSNGASTAAAAGAEDSAPGAAAGPASAPEDGPPSVAEQPAANGNSASEPAPEPAGVSRPDANGIPEDPDGEFADFDPAEALPACCPRVINVGIPGPGAEVAMWRRAWRDKARALLQLRRHAFSAACTSTSC